MGFELRGAVVDPRWAIVNVPGRRSQESNREAVGGFVPRALKPAVKPA
jgi:hypothetical protein